MFTGIVSEVGEVESASRRGGTVRFRVRAPKIAQEVHAGDSVAVNGVCQTVTDLDRQTFSFDAVTETLVRTNLNLVSHGSLVNLEPALRLGDRVSGHLVSGHVDSTAVVRSRRLVGQGNVDFAFQLPRDLVPYVHRKGSISLDGVSLTVKAVHGSMVEVTVIPYTLEHTILRHWRIGRQVNVEVDQLAKYLSRKVDRMGGGKVW